MLLDLDLDFDFEEPDLLLDLDPLLDLEYDLLLDLDPLLDLLPDLDLLLDPLLDLLMLLDLDDDVTFFLPASSTFSLFTSTTISPLVLLAFSVLVFFSSAAAPPFLGV